VEIAVFLIIAAQLPVVQKRFLSRDNKYSTKLRSAILFKIRVDDGLRSKGPTLTRSVATGHPMNRERKKERVRKRVEEKVK
jgi:hypothetical protein